MPPNVRDLVGDIREALERFPREALAEILTYVFKEYVVEGPAPLQTSAAPLRDDLEGLSFAEVVRSLQLRLDLPELGLFEVQGERVLVRIGGRQMAIETQASRADPLPQPAPMNVPPPPPLTQAAVAVAPRAAASSPGMVREELPLQGSRSQAAARTAATPAAPARPATAAAPTAAPAAPKPAEEGIEKPGRFGLLEID